MTTQNIFRAIADPTRRDILVMLSRQDMTIGEVAGNFDITRAAIKKHLHILEEGNLISVQTIGRTKVNHLETAPLKQADEWLNYFRHFWEDRFTALQIALETENKETDK